MSITTTTLAPFAPWAEIVPDAPSQMTVDDLLTWPDDDGYRYELVEGVLVRMAGTRPQAGRATRRLQLPLTLYVQAHALGTVTLPDEVYDFEHTGQPNTGLLPDLGFYYAFREASVVPNQPYPFAPDLAIEVVGSSQKQDALNSKARRYLAAGTALVWVVWPEQQVVDVWHAGDVAPMTLGISASLDGESVVPGFKLRIADLFV
jgi:Uma2 family endonuclease